ncbi:MAG: AAA family ATPase [Chitinophagaceae bacterium]|nr:AAA family ATPase [Chitinophagaceae bacterium]
MELIERDSYLSLLQTKLSAVEEGEGHSIFVYGESGIGKTSLLKALRKNVGKEYKIFEGVCDALFAPRPLAPLYDIAWQIDRNLIHDATDMHDRAGLFSKFFQELKMQDSTCILIFEDIHWADEATYDFIKFIARRITQLPCLFICTVRDNEIHSHHPFTSVIGQLSPDSYTRIELAPLSLQAVKMLAEERGYDGEDVFKVSGGNPFFVNEILASYHESVPATVRDAIMSAYHRTSEKTRQVWELLSVVPGSLEAKYVERLDPSYLEAIENCRQLQILIHENDRIFFKHELFRRAIEASLTPLKRIKLNKRILDLFLPNFECNHKIERIVHHAKNANDHEVVVRFAPLAAKEAAAVGAHIEAAKLLQTAIEYYRHNDENVLISLYDAYAYECYLTSNIKQAILYTSKRLQLLKKTNDVEKIAGCVRFLSRLSWLDGNRKVSLQLGQDAVDVFRNAPSSIAKARAYSAMAHLKMLADEFEETVKWGKLAIQVAEEVNDEDAICHALNSMGTVRMYVANEQQAGVEQLKTSLDIALRNSLDEHAARAYTNLAGNAMKIKDYDVVEKYLEDGILYSEERDLSYWMCCMLAVKAKFQLEKGNIAEALATANSLLAGKTEGTFKIYATLIVALVTMRTADTDVLPMLLQARQMAFERNEWQLIAPAMTALLEYEWLTGQEIIEAHDLKFVVKNIAKSFYYIDKNEFSFWLKKTRNQRVEVDIIAEGFDVSTAAKAQRSAAYWENKGNSYYSAMMLFEGNEDDKKNALAIMKELGAEMACERMKQQMRSAGIKSIPRGMRRSTMSNPAFLTGREMDVLQLLKDGLQNKEIANRLFISAKTVDHHISAIFFKLEVNSRAKAVNEATRLELIK